MSTPTNSFASSEDDETWVWNSPGYEGIREPNRRTLLEIDLALQNSVEQDQPLSGAGETALAAYNRVRGGYSVSSPERQRLAGILIGSQALAVHKIVCLEFQAINCRAALLDVWTALGGELFWKTQPTKTRDEWQHLREGLIGLEMLRELIRNSQTEWREWRGHLGEDEEKLIPRLIRSGFMVRQVRYLVTAPGQRQSRCCIECTGDGFDRDAVELLWGQVESQKLLTGCDRRNCLLTIESDSVRLSSEGQRQWRSWQDHFDLKWMLDALIVTVPATVVRCEVSAAVIEPDVIAPTPNAAAPPAPVVPIAVDVKRGELTFNGEAHSVSSERALRWVKVLAEHPNDWITSRELSQYDIVLLDTRPDQFKNHLPKAVLGHIESASGRGSRFTWP